MVGPRTMAFPKVFSGLRWHFQVHWELSLRWKCASVIWEDSWLQKNTFLSLFSGHCSLLTMVFGTLLTFLTQLSPHTCYYQKEPANVHQLNKGSLKTESAIQLLNSSYLGGMFLLVYMNSPSSSTWEMGQKDESLTCFITSAALMASVIPARNNLWRLTSCLQKERLPLICTSPCPSMWGSALQWTVSL